MALCINTCMRKTSNVLYNDFINFSTKEAVYLLGFLWADGSFRQENTPGKNQISLEIMLEDGKELLSIFEKTGKWNLYTRQRKHWKELIKFEASSRELKQLLVANNYLSKHEDNIIFYKIPNNLKMYFLRGLIDGDGNFYKSKDNRTNHFTICGSYEQDWNYLEKFFQDNNIKYKVIRRIQKSSRHSIIRIASKRDIIKLSKFIYNEEYDAIGLKRKYDYCKLITG